jgi:hypothetical protein
MERQTTIISTADDVNEACLRAAEEVFEGFFDHDGEPIDWWSFWDRLEAYGWTVMETDTPATKKIQKHIRRFRQET